MELMVKTAMMSVCQQYRFTLTRSWDPAKPYACVIGLNPSTADADKDDPTIRKCVGFAKQWDCGGLLMLNLFAWRATKPADLKKEQKRGRDIVGVDGNSFNHLEEYMKNVTCSHVVAAWGKNAGSRGELAAERFRSLPLLYLRLNKDGSPEHPLYVPYGQVLSKF